MIEIKANRYASLIKTGKEIETMRAAGRMLAAVRDRIAEMVRPGVSTWDLDAEARRLIEADGARPAFLGYHGYPATICASINEEVVHGIPAKDRVLKEGDLLSVDVGLVYDGFVSDTAVSVGVGRVSDDIARLIDATRRSLDAGIKAASTARRVGDISAAVQACAEAAGFSVVREYTGHGIGREMHEDPKIPNYGPAGKGLRLRPGMALAIEPMVNLGGWQTEVLDDGWTVVTKDRKASCHFEHTIALTEDGAQILTTE